MTLKHLATTRLHKFPQSSGIQKTPTKCHPRTKKRKKKYQTKSRCQITDAKKEKKIGIQIHNSNRKTRERIPHHLLIKNIHEKSKNYHPKGTKNIAIHKGELPPDAITYLSKSATSTSII